VADAAREQTGAIDEVADSARDLQESAEALEGMLDRFTVTADTVIYYAFRRFDAAATGQDDATIAVFRKLRAFVVVLWLIYPVIWVFAPAGVGLLNLTTTALVVSYLDIVAKVGFGLIALSGQLTSRAVTSESAWPAD